MIAEELINQMIPALKLTDTAEKAILWMEELKTNQLPVIENRMYKGLITEDIILALSNIKGCINELVMGVETIRRLFVTAYIIPCCNVI